MGDVRYPNTAVERFLEYVAYDTQSSEDSDSYPSTPGQRVLLERLRDECLELGLEDVEMDEYGYVFATVPATSKKIDVPVIGFLAHVDTSPEASGSDVKPIMHENYDGGDIVLPDDPAAVISAADNPALAEQVGNDIITASGTTLLGADNKAGVAEIMAAAEYLLAHPEIPHGTVRIGFTPDEEVGAGSRYFDVDRFGASCAYTMDGETLGELQVETFSADSMVITFHGFNTHPGFAKGRMVNSIKVAADFITSLPGDTLSPETTEGYEGFVHPYTLDAGVERTAVKFIVRDFSETGLKEKEALLENLARAAVLRCPGSSVDTIVEESYRNMKEVLDHYPDVRDHALEAIRRAGLEPSVEPIRGGTDGSKLSFMGLPTPNIFAGEHNFHSRFEWISTRDMHKAVEVIIELCRVWEEKS
ncbi:MAG: peptidase T [Xanthomonadales bacterium]|nr:peptidase T [Gammaproteobacteria bacterium]MBT8051928.1 peptidase T [Gammaproteobacteria bacterium]MBT8055412.1 peptidase T [Gammaproteobacteria bacterium]NNJ78792.1 peptidase T [Xanthomonadales bacterium]NNL05408.1 peptidase T [Xanthomonadales bacterium]